MGCEHYESATKRPILWKSASIRAFCLLIYFHQAFAKQKISGNDGINKEMRAVDGRIGKSILMRWKRDDDATLCPRVLNDAKEAMTRIIGSCGASKPMSAIDQSEASFTLSDGKFYGMETLVVNGSMNSVCRGNVIDFDAMLAMLNPRITYKWKTTGEKDEPSLEAPVWLTAQKIDLKTTATMTTTGEIKAKLSPLTLKDTHGFHYGAEGDGKEPFNFFVKKLESTVIVGGFKKAVALAIEEALQKCVDDKLVMELLLPNISKEHFSNKTMPTTTAKTPPDEKISSTSLPTTEKPVEETSSSPEESNAQTTGTGLPPTLVVKDHTKDIYFERIVEQPIIVYDPRIAKMNTYIPKESSSHFQIFLEKEDPVVVEVSPSDEEITRKVEKTKETMTKNRLTIIQDDNLSPGNGNLSSSHKVSIFLDPDENPSSGNGIQTQSQVSVIVDPDVSPSSTESETTPGPEDAPVTTESEKSITVESEKSTTVENEESTAVENEESTTVENEKSTTVKNEESTTVENKESTTVEKEKTTTVENKESTTVENEKSTTSDTQNGKEGKSNLAIIGELGISLE